MENILQFQDALGSLIDIAPEPKKVKRKTHSIKLIYDTHNSDVSSAWADSIYEISKSYNHLIDNGLHNHQLKLLKEKLKSYENNIDLGKRLSLKEISTLVKAL